MRSELENAYQSKDLSVKRVYTPSFSFSIYVLLFLRIVSLASNFWLRLLSTHTIVKLNVSVK